MRDIARLLLCLALCTACGCVSIDWGFYRSQAGLRDDAFLELSELITDFPLVGGNRIEFLYNGDQIFPAMFKAIENAKTTINLESYIIYEDEIGLKLCDLLARKAREGVQVRVIYDYFGGKISESTKRSLTEAGVQHYLFNDWNWLHVLRSNVRTHRKILVVDSAVGFTGGVGFADGWKGDALNSHQYRDTQVRVEGPVVNQLQKLFAGSWERTSGERLEGDLFYPEQPTVGTTLIATVGQYQGQQEWSKIRRMFLLSLAASRRYFYMNTAYFTPDPDCYRALIDAVERGVDVKVILPGPETDLPAIYLVAQKNYGRLLEAGVKLYEYQDTLMHAKTFVADGILGSVGSANFNNRTFNFNYESNLLIYDDEAAKKMEHQFEVDLERSNQITITEWEKRRLSQRFLEQMVGVLEGWM